MFLTNLITKIHYTFHQLFPSILLFLTKTISGPVFDRDLIGGHDTLFSVMMGVVSYCDRTFDEGNVVFYFNADCV